MSEDPIRICLLVNGMSVTRWESAALSKMIEETNVSIELIVDRDDSRLDTCTDESSSFFQQILHYFHVVRRNGGRILLTVENKLQSRFGRQAALFDSVPIRDVPGCSSTEVIDGTLVPEGEYFVSLEETVVDRIGEKCDLVIMFGYPLLTGDILTCTEHGVWSYHHGDIREYRGVAPILWGIVDGADEFGVTLQQLEENVDAGGVIDIQTVRAAPAVSYQDIRTSIYETSIPMLEHGIANIRTEGWEPAPPNETGELYVSDDIDLPSVVRFYAHRFVRRLRSILQ